VNDGRLCRAEEFATRGLAYACIPLSDAAPPQPGDDEICWNALPIAGAFVEDEIARGHGVVVHCTAGKDRTGLFLAYFLMRHTGVSAEHAITQVRRSRPIALSAIGWEAFARQVLAHFER
jgi:protein-tyrosine phosphatase